MEKKRASKEEIESRIFEIKNLDLSKASIDEIKQLLILLVHQYTMAIPIFDPGIILYRATPYQEKPQNFSYLSYPPPSLTRINRENRENEPMFYCSTSEDVPFYEIGLKPGDKVVRSKWKTTKELTVNSLGYTKSVFENLISSRGFPIWGDDREHHPKIQEEINLLIHNFFAETFSQSRVEQNRNIYKLTIAIAEIHYLHEVFDGLFYPTMVMRANADNFAIRPSFIDSGGLLFQEVYYTEVLNINTNGLAYESKNLDWANSISNTGQIKWKGRMPQVTVPPGQEVVIREENGKWVARDENGDLLELS